MGRFSYSQRHLDFLRREYPKRSVEGLTTAFNGEFGLNKTPRQIYATLKNHKIRCGRPRGLLNIGRNSLCNEQQDAYLREHYQNMTLPELTPAFNQTFGTNYSKQQLRSYLKNHKITCQRTGKFEPGNVPPPSAHPTGPNKTSFKKGHKPHNTRELGAERIDSDGYIWIKVDEPDPHFNRPTRFKHKHVHIWEQAYGAVPEGMVVRFKTADRSNVTLDNLELINRTEHAILNKNQYHQLPPEIQPSVRLIAKLQAKAHERKEDAA